MIANLNVNNSRVIIHILEHVASQAIVQALGTVTLEYLPFDVRKKDLELKYYRRILHNVLSLVLHLENWQNAGFFSEEAMKNIDAHVGI